MAQPRPRRSAATQWIVLAGILSVFALLWFFAFQMRPAQHKKLVPIPPSSPKSHFLTKAEQSHATVTKALKLAEASIDAHRDMMAASRVAAILIFTEYNPNLRVIVRQLDEFDFIKEIVLWQDGGGDALEEVQAVVKMSSKAHYIVGQRHLKKMAKYFACAHGAVGSNACFYQGLYYDTIDYVELLHASFLRAPNRIHAAADPITLYHDSELCFTHKKWNMHAGLSYPEYGVMLHSELAAQFLHAHLIGSSEAEVKDTFLMEHADSHFSVYTNQPPLLLSTHIRKFQQSLGHAKLIHLNSYERRLRPASLEASGMAFNRLMKDLSSPEASPQQEVVWLPASAASAVQRCLFVTNEICTGVCSEFDAPMDLITRLQYLVRVHCEAKTKDKPTACVPQKAQMFAFMSYHHAVDGDPRSLWMSQHNATAGSYFGLDLLYPRTNLHNISVVVAHPFQNELVMEISADGKDWFEVTNLPPVVESLGKFISLPMASATYPLDILLAQTWERITADTSSSKNSNNVNENDDVGSTGGVLPPLYIRYVRFRSLRDMGAPFIVSEIAFDHTETEKMDHISRIIDVAEENTWADTEESD